MVGLGNVFLHQFLTWTKFSVDTGRELAARLAAEAYPDAAARLVEALLPRVEVYYRGWEMPELEPYSTYN